MASVVPPDDVVVVVDSSSEDSDEDEDEDEDEDNDEELFGVCKSDAKYHYALNDSDLKPLPRVVKSNPHWRQGPPMQLFRDSDLTFCAIRKYGGHEKWQTKLASNRARAEKTAATRKDNCTTRRGELVVELRRLRCEFRNDSTLCQDYVRRGTKCGWTASRVARRMAEMRFLHEHTSFSKEIREAVFLDDDYVDRTVFGRRALHAVVEDGVLATLPVQDFPPFWPWMSSIAWTVDVHRLWRPWWQERARTLVMCIYKAHPEARHCVLALVAAYAETSLRWYMSQLDSTRKRSDGGSSAQRAYGGGCGGRAR
jgi:hypothetical protein